MTVDREQIRRDAKNGLRGNCAPLGFDPIDLLANHCLDLLAELEQADDFLVRERLRMHEQKHRAEQAEEDRHEAQRIAEVWRTKRDYTLETKLAAEARLAKVPALVEALKETETELRVRAAYTNAIDQIDPPYTATSVLSLADELAAALAEWERE